MRREQTRRLGVSSTAKSSLDQARIRKRGSANSAWKSLNLLLQWGEAMSTNISVGFDVKGGGTVGAGDTRPVGRS
jgi:hypothetical protein